MPSTAPNYEVERERERRIGCARRRLFFGSTFEQPARLKNRSAQQLRVRHGGRSAMSVFEASWTRKSARRLRLPSTSTSRTLHLVTRASSDAAFDGSDPLTRREHAEPTQPRARHAGLSGTWRSDYVQADSTRTRPIPSKPGPRGPRRQDRSVHTLDLGRAYCTVGLPAGSRPSKTCR